MASAEFAAGPLTGLQAPLILVSGAEQELGDAEPQGRHSGPPHEGEGIREGPKAFAVSSNKPLTSKFRGGLAVLAHFFRWHSCGDTLRSRRCAAQRGPDTAMRMRRCLLEQEEQALAGGHQQWWQVPVPGQLRLRR